MESKANYPEEKKTQTKGKADENSRIPKVISICCQDPHVSYSPLISANVHGRKYPWKQIIVQVERIAWHTKKTKFKKILAIDLSENCMPCPSYMKLYNLVYSTSVKSRNIFKEYNWFCKCSFERYKIEGLSNPLKPKETDSGEKRAEVGGGV